ncbi:MAG: hypothetical protein ABL952_15450 [Pyrinomonadaceae bacterium]
MKTRFFAVAAIGVLLLNVAVFTKPDTRSSAVKKARAAKLVAMLPASDGVVSFDSKRFLTDALPKIMSGNQPMLGEVMAKLNEMETRTGIDLRKFEQVAVGVAFKKVSAKEMDYEPVAIASGDVNAGALVAMARLASNGTYRTEKIGERTVYIFTVKDVFQKTSAKTTNSTVADMFDKALKGMTKDIAVTAFDSRTLVMGSLARVTETIEGRTKVAAELSGLLSQRDSSVLTFAAKPPGSLRQMIPLDNDELGNSIDAIQTLSGSMDVTVAGAAVSMLARTKTTEQAAGIKDLLDVGQMLGKSVFGNSKRPDQQMYARLIKAAKFDAKGTDVTLDVMVPQADIDMLMKKVK